jgi:hypothetical protein
MESKKHLDAQSLETLRLFLSKVRDHDLICSSFFEFAPWYRYNYGFLVLCWLCGIKFGPKDIWRVLKSSIYNLIFKSKIHISVSTKPNPSKSVIFTWIINRDESRSDCVRRYFGSLADQPDSQNSAVWAIASFKPEHSTIERLNAEGVTLVWMGAPRPKDVLKALLRILRGLNPLLIFDAEFWKGEQISGHFLSWLNANNAEQIEILLPYEQQPWQLRLFFRLQNQNKTRFKIIGDAHTSLTNFPSQFIKTRFSPHRLIVHGNDFKKCLVDQLGWNASEIQTSPSSRFTKKLLLETSLIVLPYVLPDISIIIGALKVIANLGIPDTRWTVKPHPARQNDPQYQNIYNQLINAVPTLNTIHRTSSASKTVLVFGVSTYILEALESAFEVYNFIEHPETESYPSDIWTGLATEKLSENLFKYTLRTSQSYVIYP